MPLLLSCSLAGIACLNATELMSVVSDVYCQIEVSASGLLLDQRSPTDCGLSECNECKLSLNNEVVLAHWELLH